MPSGLILIRWDNQVGPILVKAFPENLKVTNNLLTQIYSAHRYSSLAANFSSLTLKNSKIVSFFSGMEEGKIVGVPNYVVALILRRDENIAAFRDILKKAAAEILGNIDNKKYEKLMPKIYQEMSQVKG
jgi:hypothetical protein